MTNTQTEYQYYQRSQLMRELASSAHCKEYRGQTSSAIYPEIKSRIEQMSLAPASHILDAGCGNGAFTITLAKEFSLFVHGIDLEEELTKEAERRTFGENILERCKFSKGDFSDFQVYPDVVFDAIICIGSLYWGQPLSTILDIWHRVTRPGSQLLIFLNLAYAPLNLLEQEAIGKTTFFPALTLQFELSKHGWALCEWSDTTLSYIEWLRRWCQEMEALSSRLYVEMGKDKAARLIGRFETYLTLAQKRAVRRIILRAEHV